jgi:hypothetical protein
MVGNTQAAQPIPLNDCDALLGISADEAERTSTTRGESSCYAKSVSLSSRPLLSAPPRLLRPRHRPGGTVAASMSVNTMAAGCIGVSAGATAISATAEGRDGAITIYAAADNGGERVGPRWPGRFSRRMPRVINDADAARRAIAHEPPVPLFS